MRIPINVYIKLKLFHLCFFFTHVRILHLVLTGAGRGLALSRLVDLNATSVIVKMIMQIHSAGIPESLLQELVRILAQLAQKGN